MQVMPTHTCFDDATDFIVKSWIVTPDVAANLVLVHAICCVPADAIGGPLAPGTRYAHAWVEEQETVWFAGLIDGEKMFIGIERAEFHRSVGLIEQERYTMAEVFDAHARQGPGPWNPAIRALCRDRQPGATS